MPAESQVEIARQWQRAFTGESLTGLGEAALLERFLKSGDALAFEMIVSRHGPLVLSVCRSILAPDTHAVDDAFQATFLVLIKRARSIRDFRKLASWLHGVARRVARRSRSQSARLRRREQRCDFMETTAPPEHTVPPEELAALHDELSKLPRAYRDVILLCDLESRTHAESARLLGWPVGTVKGRLSRAREQLRKRLGHHGSIHSTGSLSGLFANQANATPAPELVGATIHHALALIPRTSGPGAGLVSASVLALADGVTQAMIASKIGTIAATAVVAATITTASALVAASAASRQDADKPAASVPTNQKEYFAQAKAPGDANSPVAKAQQELQAARVAVSRRDYEEAAQRVLDELPWWGPRSVENVRQSSVAMMKREQAILGPAGAAEAHLKRMTGLNADAQKILESLRGLDEGQIAERVNSIAQKRPMNPPAFNAGHQRRLAADTKVFPELNVYLAEARLWVEEAKSGREPSVGDYGYDPIEGSTTSTPLDPRTSAILKALDRPMELNPGQEVTLKDFFQYVRDVTKSAELPKGLPIYADPSALMEAEKTLASKFTVELDEIPLKEALRIALQQLDLNYVVKDGLVIIVNVGSDWSPDPEHPMLGSAPVPGYGQIPLQGFPSKPREKKQPAPYSEGGFRPGGGFR